MPRFFFDVDDGEWLTRDDQGSEFTDLAAAEREAAHALGDLARDILREGSGMQTLSINIRNADDEQLLQLRLTYASSTPAYQFH